MLKDAYTKELDSIEAGDEFKERTKELLAKQLQQPANLKKEKPKLLWFTPRRMAGVAAAAVVLIGGIAVLRGTVGTLQNKIESLQKQPSFFAGAASAPFAPAETTAGQNGQPSAYFGQPPLAKKEAADAETTPAYAPAMASGDLPLLPVETPTDTEAQTKQADLYLYAKPEQAEQWATQPLPAGLPGALPVYRNTRQQTNSGYLPGGLSQPQMETLLTEQAAALSTVIPQFTTTSAPMKAGGTVQGLYSVQGTATDGTLFTAKRDGQVEIEFAAPLPAAASAADDAAQSRQVLQALMQQVAPLLAGMQTPKGLATRQWNADGTSLWRYSVYDEGDGLAQTVFFNRSLSGLEFVMNDQGQLTGLVMRRADGTQPVGLYPILSLQQAEEQLLTGKAKTPRGQQTPPSTRQKIAAVEIVYPDNPQAQVHMPYYKFYVEAEPQKADLPQGLRSYTLWYLPAIEPAYLLQG